MKNINLEIDVNINDNAIIISEENGSGYEYGADLENKGTEEIAEVVAEKVKDYICYFKQEADYGRKINKRVPRYRKSQA